MLNTDRLLLRDWKESDLVPFAAMNADPEVMEHFPNTLSQAESDAFVKKIQQHIDEHSWGLWAVALKETGEFLGFIGLWPVGFKAHFTPAVEIGWRLAKPFWGKGYALEGAQAVLKDGFERLGLEEIVSLTAKSNERSQKLMQRLGMHHDPKDDFAHPELPDGHLLKPHVLYRINRPIQKVS